MDEIILNGYIEQQLTQLSFLHKLKEALNLRLHYIDNNYRLKDDYSRNEDYIKKVRTEMEIQKIDKEKKRVDEELQDNFKLYFQSLDGADSSMHSN